VAVKVRQKRPAVFVPQWATRSTSKNRSKLVCRFRSSHAKNTRTGISFFNLGPALVRLFPRTSSFFRATFSSMSISAGLSVTSNRLFSSVVPKLIKTGKPPALPG
jgi:hypothetical protein